MALLQLQVTDCMTVKRSVSLVCIDLPVSS